MDTSVQKGDKVQYYRKANETEESWKGPAQLFAFDGTFRLI